MSLTARQLDIRRGGLTAGDMRAIVGEDPYGRTPHDVFLSKLGLEKPVNETEPMEWGNVLEPEILKRIGRKSGLHVLPVPSEELTVVHKVHKRHIATPDALLSTTPDGAPEALGEAKAVGLHAMAGWGDTGTDEIPDWCLVQVTWQMHVKQIPVCHVGALLGLETRHYTIRLDTELEGVLVDECDRFWRDHVEPRKSPPIDGSEGSRRMLSAIYPRNNGTMVLAGADAEALARAYFSAKGARDASDAHLERVRQALIVIAGDADGIQGDGWRLFLKWREATSYHVDKDGYRHFDLRAVGKNKKDRAA